MEVNVKGKMKAMKDLRNFADVTIDDALSKVEVPDDIEMSTDEWGPSVLDVKRESAIYYIDWKFVGEKSQLYIRFYEKGISINPVMGTPINGNILKCPAIQMPYVDPKFSVDIITEKMKKFFELRNEEYEES